MPEKLVSRNVLRPEFKRVQHAHWPHIARLSCIVDQLKPQLQPVLLEQRLQLPPVARQSADSSHLHLQPEHLQFGIEGSRG